MKTKLQNNKDSIFLTKPDYIYIYVCVCVCVCVCIKNKWKSE